MECPTRVRSVRSSAVDEGREVVGVGVHLVAVPGLGRAAVAAAVVRDDPVPVLGEEPRPASHASALSGQPWLRMTGEPARQSSPMAGPSTPTAGGHRLFLAENGFRAVAHDRRGHGRSSQTWGGNEMDTYADDLATLIETLDLTGVTLVGFSTGGGEVDRYLGRHGSARVTRLALVSAVPPLMLKTDDNPGGFPIEVFDGIRAGLEAPIAPSSIATSPPARSSDSTAPRRPQAFRDAFWFRPWLRSPQGPRLHHGVLGHRLPPDLATIDVPTPAIHGDDDQFVPIDAAASAPRSSSTERSPHGVPRRPATASPRHTREAPPATCSPSSTADLL